MKEIVVIDADDTSRQAFEKLMKKAGLARVRILAGIPGKEAGADTICLWLGHKGEKPAGDIAAEEDRFIKPLRAGAVLERIKAYMRLADQPQESVSFGGYMLKVPENELFKADKSAGAIRLTEKEAKILLLLALQKNQVVGRKTLLEEVWGYADGLETHTLETHIYRLRQKIETDPAKPALLITEESGYRLKI